MWRGVAGEWLQHSPQEHRRGRGGAGAGAESRAISTGAGAGAGSLALARSTSPPSLAGDARAAFPPDLGQGVNSALEDVAELDQVQHTVAEGQRGRGRSGSQKGG
ncbi:hypothetical protein HaLaN_31121 [Haematococcus lacustris]|uniref:Uncharacterized protein n=1 Tax=Haematococcus lacustris TaxID=44745 RepID=A0A6A0AI35_HAELA|nr:hypothetical protein HaLaN_31121 [Haematococcus lacustris]